MYKMDVASSVSQDGCVYIYILFFNLYTSVEISLAVHINSALNFATFRPVVLHRALKCSSGDIQR